MLTWLTANQEQSGPYSDDPCSVGMSVHPPPPDKGHPNKGFWLAEGHVSATFYHEFSLSKTIWDNENLVELIRIC